MVIAAAPAEFYRVDSPPLPADCRVTASSPRSRQPTHERRATKNKKSFTTTEKTGQYTAQKATPTTHASPLLRRASPTHVLQKRTKQNSPSLAATVCTSERPPFPSPIPTPRSFQRRLLRQRRRPFSWPSRLTLLIFLPSSSCLLPFLIDWTLRLALA